MHTGREPVHTIPTAKGDCLPKFFRKTALLEHGPVNFFLDAGKKILLKLVEESFQEHSRYSHPHRAIHLPTSTVVSNLVRPSCGTTYVQMIHEYDIGREIYASVILQNTHSHYSYLKQ